MKAIAFTARERAELLDAPDDGAALGPRQVEGATIATLVSPGTEINWGYLGEKFPLHPGYSCVFTVERVGAEVTDLSAGMKVFAMGPHQSRQRMAREDVLPVPEGLAAETAVFARLMGVSMSTLVTTTARPPGPVLVTGLGPVGNLAAQVFAACGYDVIASDPVESRQAVARAAGLRDVRGVVDARDALAGRVALHVECSGHEQAVLTGCKLVRKRGEVVLIGVPWQKRTELSAHDILHAVFFKYVVLRSGWEWELPRQHADFAAGSMTHNFATALRWLADGRVRVEGLYVMASPADAQAVYQGLLKQTFARPAAVFDWRASV